MRTTLSIDPTAPEALPSPRVLIVDDDLETRRWLVEVLSGAGYVVDAAGDGDEARAIMHEFVPALIVSDVDMPHGGGMELLAAVRNESRTTFTPVIFLSGSSTPSMKVDGFERGANDFVTKPVDSGELLARIGAQLRQAQANQSLREQALIDYLTGVYNRRGLRLALGQAFSQWQRHQRSMSILIVDIDHFKHFNDQYGHAVGDAVLRGVAGALAANVRLSDTIGRLGGDEFLVVLPDTPRAMAETIARRCRAAVGELALGPDGDLRASISIGLDHARPGVESAEVLLSGADQSMYRDKRAHKRFAHGSVS